jgi:hypothetical protein
LAVPFFHPQTSGTVNGHKPSQFPNGKTDRQTDVYGPNVSTLFSQTVHCHENVYNDNGTTGLRHCLSTDTKMVAMATFLHPGSSLSVKYKYYNQVRNTNVMTKPNVNVLFYFTTAGLV